MLECKLRIPAVLTIADYSLQALRALCIYRNGRYHALQVHNMTIEAGAYPSPLNYWNFPKSVCTSVNEVQLS